MSDSPCHHTCDFTDEPVLADAGCCSPIPFRRDCEAPTLPTPECDEEAGTVTFDSETEEFVVLGNLYDSTCSALTDSTGSTLTALVA